jgi:hypothetical protein
VSAERPLPAVRPTEVAAPRADPRSEPQNRPDRIATRADRRAAAEQTGVYERGHLASLRRDWPARLPSADPGGTPDNRELCRPPSVLGQRVRGLGQQKWPAVGVDDDDALAGGDAETFRLRCVHMEIELTDAADSTLTASGSHLLHSVFRPQRPAGSFRSV